MSTKNFFKNRKDTNLDFIPEIKCITNKVDCESEATHNLNRLLDKPGPYI